MVIASIAVYIVSCLISITNKKTRLLPAILLSLMGVLFAFRDPHEADTEAYYAVYEALKGLMPTELVTTFGITKGFLHLMYLFAKLGFSYQMFRFVLFLVATILIYKGINGLCYNYLLLICLYAFFPFGYDIDQIRQFLVNAMVVFAMRYIVKDNVKREDILKYVAIIAFASLFHLSAPFYLLYLLILLKREDFYKSIVIVSSLVFGASLVSRPNSLIRIVANAFHINKLLSYTMTLSDYRMNPLLSIFELAFVLYLVWNSYKCREISFEYENVGRKIWKVTCVTCLVLPTLTFSLMFERLLRPAIIMNYFQLGNTLYYRNTNKSTRILLLFAFVLVISLRSSISMDYVTKIFENFYLDDYTIWR